ncbi:MAG: thiazole synthase [Planctomycetota bacterium]
MISENDDKLKLGKYEFKSRLILGSGKFTDFEIMKKCYEIAEVELITVAIRRVNLENPRENILSYIDRKKYTLLPNTAGCYSVEEAVRIAYLGRELCNTELVKLEVIGDRDTLYPDNTQTLEATRILVKEGFAVLAYTNDDVVAALRLEEAGATAVMPLGAPIGSGMGILNPYNIQAIIQKLTVPCIVDAGVGVCSDVAIAMEMGADGVLLNTAVACAKDPVKMARAMKLACQAGRLTYLAGRIPKSYYANPSSPLYGMPAPPKPKNK